MRQTLDESTFADICNALITSQKIHLRSSFGLYNAALVS